MHPVNITIYAMKKIFAIAAMAAGIFALSSCSQKVDVAGDWIVTEVDGSSLPELFEGQETPFISFNPADGRLHGNTGVNVINSTYTQDGKNLEIGMAASTMMAGPEEWMQTERQIIDALGNTRTVKAADENTIELCDSTGKAVLTLEKRQK